VNKKHTKLSTFLAFFAVLLAGLLSPNNVKAQYYGQSESNLTVVIDKKIGYSGDKTFYDNVDSSQKLFIDGDMIIFKIVIENKNDVSLYNLNFKDILPKHLTLMFYPGIYDKTANSIVTKIDELKSGDRKEYLVIARISDVPASNYALSKFQETNYVTVSNDKVNDSDTAKYFVGYKAVPSTGSNDMLIKTGLILTATLTAMALRKKARGY
jgi:uncharacterized repeat protein (TIGR01451 family)